MVTVAQLADHIARLAERHRVEVVYKAGAGRAWRRSRKVRIPPVRSDVTYALALHELGHVLGEQSGRRVDREVQAWQWAEREAIAWSRGMEAKRARSLTSYVRWAERRQRADADRVFIPEHHPIYRLACGALR